MDINPQWMKVTVTQTGADAVTTAALALPVIRAREGVTPTIIEVLKVIFITDSVAEVDSVLNGALTTKNFGTTAVAVTEPSAIAYARWFVRLTTSGEFSVPGSQIFPTTDDAGHGVLVATDNLYLQASGASTGSANVITAWILYRFKRVGTLEYVGIVQSQQ